MFKMDLALNGWYSIKPNQIKPKLADHRVKMKESEKVDKFLGFARELKKPWNMYDTVIPIVIVALITVLEVQEKSWGNWRSEENRDYPDQNTA